MAEQDEKGLLESFKGVITDVKDAFAKTPEDQKTDIQEDPEAAETPKGDPGPEPEVEDPENTDETKEGEGEEDEGPDPYDIKSDDVISVDGKTYTAKELIASYENKETWNKKNTTASQKIASEKEALKNTVVVSNVRKEALAILAEDPTIIEMVVSQLEEAGKTDAVEKFKSALDIDDSKVVNPYLEELTALKEKDKQREMIARYTEAKSNFQKEYKLSDEIVDKVEEACAAHMQETDQTISLEHMYLRMKEKGEIKVEAPDTSKKPAKTLRVPPTLKNPAGGRKGEVVAPQKTVKPYRRGHTFDLTVEDIAPFVK